VISLNVGAHEAVHAVTCVLVGGELLELAALYARCQTHALVQAKIVDGAAPLFNLLVGTLIWLVLPRVPRSRPHLNLFLWLLMVMNWLYGAPYLMVSGVANLGDFATVIRGYEPHGLWRVGLTLAGSALFMGAVWLSLRRLGQFVGGQGSAQFRLANAVSLLATPPRWWWC
jgi:hypothetical protein